MAGTRAFVLPPELPDPEPEPELPDPELPETPAPPVGCVVVVFVPDVDVVLDVGVVVVRGPLVAGGVAFAAEVVLSGAVGLEVVALVVACFELPQPVASASAGTTARTSARRLKDRCIAADVERVDEA